LRKLRSWLQPSHRDEVVVGGSSPGQPEASAVTGLGRGRARRNRRRRFWRCTAATCCGRYPL